MWNASSGLADASNLPAVAATLSCALSATASTGKRATHPPPADPRERELLRQTIEVECGELQRGLMGDGTVVAPRLINPAGQSTWSTQVPR